MSQPGTVALDLTCAACGRLPRVGEVWRVVFVDLGEVAVDCPAECAEREFGDDARRSEDPCGDDVGRWTILRRKG
jgi:hypothetical protein